MVHIFDDASINGHRPQTAGQFATAAYLFVMLLGLPLAVHDGYFDITETKFTVFFLVSALYVLLELVLWLCRRAVLAVKPIPALRIPDVGMALFLLAYLLGGPLAGDTGAWLGYSGRYQGIYVILLYALVYFCLSRNFGWTRLNGLALCAGVALPCLLAILNDLGCDPLGMVGRLYDAQRWQFVSTLGNVNFYSSWLGALLPVPLYLWCFAEKQGWQTVLGLTLLFGFCGMLPTASESYILALLAALWLLPLFLFQSPRAFSRYGLALLVMALTLAVLRLIMRFVPQQQYLSFSMRVLTHPAVLAGLALLGAALWFFLKKKTAPLRGKKVYLIVSLALAALCILALVLRNTMLKNLSLGFADRFLLFNERWGTDRGRIWAYCLRAFMDGSPLQKLFGGGAGCLLRYDLAHPLFPDAYLDSAHNEYLQYLLSAGVVGLIGYMTLLSGTAVAVFRRANRSPLMTACMLGALAYAAQAFVNIAQPVSTPYLFLLLGMAAGCMVRLEYPEATPSSAAATSAKAGRARRRPRSRRS